MFNDDLSDLFYELGDMEELEGKRWEALAYRKVAANIAGLGEDIREISARHELRKIDGVGDAIEKKILQYISEGRISTYESLKQKYPIDFTQLRKIQGLGPKKIGILFIKLGITDVDSLKVAIDKHLISKLEGFGDKTEENLKRGLSTLDETGAKRVLLGRAYNDVNALAAFLESSGLFSKLMISGSTRRMKETIGDVDILAVAPSREKATDLFVSSEYVSSTISSGESKVTVNLKIGVTCDLRFIETESFGAALQYFTGSKDHNVKLRDLAISKGMRLNEYSLSRGQEVVAGKEESSIYRELGMQYIEPELRENSGEIEAALSGEIPDIVRYDSIKGDTHSHTLDSDGRSSLDDMVVQAKKNNLEYLVITNHSKSLKIANGLDESRFASFNGQIDMAARTHNFHVLKGVELEILRDGSLDLDTSTLEKMDFVLASLHQFVTSDREENTLRVVKAIRSGMINAIAHPTGRMIGSRPAYNLDLDRIAEACLENSVCLEINGTPERTDLPWDIVKRLRNSGVKFTLGSDAHSLASLANLRFAIAIARRGWLTPDRVINTLNYDDFLAYMKR